MIGARSLVLSEASLSAAKWLAVVLMIVDHVNRYLLDGGVPWMHAAGRVSMPLFAVVVGFNLARPGMLDRGGFRRMALRLALVGAVSCAPFIALSEHLAGGWWPLNVMVTLFVAVVVVWMIELRQFGVALLVGVVGGALGEYAWAGVGLCVFAWAFRRLPCIEAASGFVLCLALLWFCNGNAWALGVLPVLAVLQRWRVVLPRWQLAFYAFYPLHLALFVVLRA